MDAEKVRELTLFQSDLSRIARLAESNRMDMVTITEERLRGEYLSRGFSLSEASGGRRQVYTVLMRRAAENPMFVGAGLRLMYIGGDDWKNGTADVVQLESYEPPAEEAAS